MNKKHIKPQKILQKVLPNRGGYREELRKAAAAEAAELMEQQRVEQAKLPFDVKFNVNRLSEFENECTNEFITKLIETRFNGIFTLISDTAKLGGEECIIRATNKDTILQSLLTKLGYRWKYLEISNEPRQYRITWGKLAKQEYEEEILEQLSKKIDIVNSDSNSDESDNELYSEHEYEPLYSSADDNNETNFDDDDNN